MNDQIKILEQNLKNPIILFSSILASGIFNQTSIEPRQKTFMLTLNNDSIIYNNNKFKAHFNGWKLHSIDDCSIIDENESIIPLDNDKIKYFFKIYQLHKKKQNQKKHNKKDNTNNKKKISIEKILQSNDCLNEFMQNITKINLDNIDKKFHYFELSTQEVPIEVYCKFIKDKNKIQKKLEDQCFRVELKGVSILSNKTWINLEEYIKKKKSKDLYFDKNILDSANLNAQRKDNEKYYQQYLLPEIFDIDLSTTILLDCTTHKFICYLSKMGIVYNIKKYLDDKITRKELEVYIHHATYFGALFGRQCYQIKLSSNNRINNKMIEHIIRQSKRHFDHLDMDDR